MGTVLLHVGMPKTGSTSIQRWLREHLVDLRAQGISVVREQDAMGSRPIRFAAFTSGFTVVANSFLVAYARELGPHAQPGESERLVDELVESLDALASSLGTVLLTSEGLSTLIVRGEEPFVRGLERLAGGHTVRVACYVRPQHGALEARWRQWGYSDPLAPAAWVRAQADQLRYDVMVDQVGRLAPSVSFEVRPFRRDLLLHGDVVSDFAAHFCGLAGSVPGAGFRDNPGLPLDLAILLRSASIAMPPGVDMRGPNGLDTGLRKARLAELASRWGIPDSAAARRSREVLHAYAHQEFEAGNLELVRRFAWPTESFIPTPPQPAVASAADLSELDGLWSPEPTAALGHLAAALGALIE